MAEEMNKIVLDMLPKIWDLETFEDDMCIFESMANDILSTRNGLKHTADLLSAIYLLYKTDPDMYNAAAEHTRKLTSKCDTCAHKQLSKVNIGRA